MKKITVIYEPFLVTTSTVNEKLPPH